MSPTGRYDPLADGGSSRRRGKNRPAPIRGRLYLIQLPLKPAPLVQVNVGFYEDSFVKPLLSAAFMGGTSRASHEGR